MRHSVPSWPRRGPEQTRAVGEYRISVRARQDLLDIYEFSEAIFGRRQTELYLAGLERTFQRLADSRRLGQDANEIVPGYRRYRFQSHYIFFTRESDVVLIRALIHVRMNLRPELFE